MTKLEGMTNDQLTNDRDLVCQPFALRLCFAILRYCHVSGQCRAAKDPKIDLRDAMIGGAE